MPDTVYYNAEGEILPYDSLPGEVKQAMSEIEYVPNSNKEGGKHYATVFWIFIIAVAVFAVRRALKEKGTTILRGSYDTRAGMTIGNEKLADLLSEYHVYEGHALTFPKEQYEKILTNHSAYYRRLVPALQDKFVKRVKRFLADKTFLLKSNEPFVEMPILVSATAVQLTFGLDKYLLPHYQYIRIYDKGYFAKGTLKLLAGHVYGNTITLAWDHFLHGHAEYSDGINVGLHEMAHALYYQLVESDNGRCREFSANFDHVLAEGDEVYKRKATRPSELFTDNAYRNLQEFWAESVEVFFERPSELKRENADLYAVLSGILNQDPANKLYPVG